MGPIPSYSTFNGPSSIYMPRNRAVIEQAKGILMGRTGVTADEAYELISQQSQALNKKVYAIAQEIVERAAQHSRSHQN